MEMQRLILIFALLSCLRIMPALAIETTLYVGKHFEVRDHDQPTKYVFNGDTRIARITGSLSTNTRIQRFRLRSGWNLLSLAVSVTNLSEQLQRPGVINSARAWNPQTGNYSTAPQVAPAGTVLWVNVTTNTTLGVVGTYADPVHRQITAGATYLASTGLEAWTPTLPPSVTAWSFDSQPTSFNPQPTWHARLTGDLSSINDLPNTFPPGQVLYVINNAPFELDIPDPALRIRYYHQDHLGSSSVMTDASGVLVEETAFYPFGIPRHERRLRQIEEHYKFTQKEHDRESDLHYFEARYLAGAMSRFLSVDSKYAKTEASVGDPQAMNLYAYVQNNPLQYTDPTGLQPVPDLAKIAHDAVQIDTRKNRAAADEGPGRWLKRNPFADADVQEGPNIHTDAGPSSPNLHPNIHMVDGTTIPPIGDPMPSPRNLRCWAEYWKLQEMRTVSHEATALFTARRQQACVDSTSERCSKAEQLEMDVYYGGLDSLKSAKEALNRCLATPTIEVCNPFNNADCRVIILPK